jgi:TolB-like protein/tetratricopeptide (TPR) repeat protein
MSESNKAVFLSYASQDAEAAKRISEALRAGGIEVWFDQSELRGGDAWDQKIRQRIRDCALFIPIISAQTATRHEGYFRLEWDLADQRTHMIARNKAFIIPVCLDVTPDAGADVPDSFHRVQWTRLPAGETPPALVTRLSQLLSPSEPQAPAQTRASTGSAPSSQSRLVVLLIVVLTLIGVGYYALDKFLLSKRAVAGGSASATTSLAGESAPSSINEKSIAVLPFADMSEKKDQEYFSDGLAEELLDLLAKTPGLHVIARTSSFSFKGKSEDIPTIGKKLNVANILEGSVRKSGNRLRVTTQLIRASDGEHLWSETYDRELTDVFKVQDEIAAAVVGQLKLALAPTTPQSSAHRTSNIEAFNQYLLGRQFGNRQNDDGSRLAIEAYTKAIALDPSYAAAYAGLALSESLLADDIGDAAGLKRAEAHAEKAVTLASQGAEGYAARGYLRNLYSWDWAGAEADFTKALLLDPAVSGVQAQYANLLGSLGRLPEAIAVAQKATKLDPLWASGWDALGRYQIFSRDFPRADEALRRALEIQPELAYALSHMGTLQLLEDNAAPALATCRKIDFAALRLPCIATAEHTLGHSKESQQALEELIAKYGKEAAYQVAEVFAWRGEKTEAFEWLERAYQQRDGGLSDLKVDVLLAGLRGDPRFEALLRKMNLPA